MSQFFFSYDCFFFATTRTQPSPITGPAAQNVTHSDRPPYPIRPIKITFLSRCAVIVTSLFNVLFWNNVLCNIFQSSLNNFYGYGTVRTPYLTMMEYHQLLRNKKL